LFKREQGGITVRAAVLAHLLPDKTIAENGYVPIGPYLQRNKQLSLQQENGEIVLRVQSR
jgi:carboxyl-terminal processing protease